MKRSIKNIIISLICILAFIGFSCQKEIFESEFKGTVKHYYTKQPISGIPIKLYHSSGSGILSNIEDVSITYTDNNGNFSFKLKKERSGGYGVKPYQNSNKDSSINQWKYYLEGNSAGINSDLHPEILLRPTGDLGIYLSDSSWVILPADTFVIESIYTKDTLFKGKIKWKEFWVEPSQMNKFIWYGIKNKEKVYYEEKYVYAPNAYFHIIHGQMGYTSYPFTIKLH